MVTVIFLTLKCNTLRLYVVSCYAAKYLLNLRVLCQSSVNALLYLEQLLLLFSTHYAGDKVYNIDYVVNELVKFITTQVWHHWVPHGQDLPLSFIVIGLLYNIKLRAITFYYYENNNGYSIYYLSDDSFSAKFLLMQISSTKKVERAAPRTSLVIKMELDYSPKKAQKQFNGGLHINFLLQIKFNNQRSSLSLVIILKQFFAILSNNNLDSRGPKINLKICLHLSFLDIKIWLQYLIPNVSYRPETPF
jgi:hypothetical protein